MASNQEVVAPIKVPTIDFPSLVTRSVTRTESEGLEPLNSPGTIDLTGAEIPDGRSKPEAEGDPHHSAPSINLPSQKAEYASHIALDLGGSLVKLVYFTSDTSVEELDGVTPLVRHPSRGGKLHFVKFETSKVEDCIQFIKAHELHHRTGDASVTSYRSQVVATGGGAYKFHDLFEERLGVSLRRLDEMECLVSGCNFLLKAIRREAFHWDKEEPNYNTPASTDQELYPYMLVNIGSGVSILKVTGDHEYSRISGSSLGGGTFWGLSRLLTGVSSFDEILQLSAKGNNRSVDMLVGDIYGGRDYNTIGLDSTTIASSFGKVVGQDKILEQYDKADIAMALMRMISYNIGHLAFMNAKEHGLTRIIFGGFFIRGHAYTMETIDYALKFWSKGELRATFLRHEGFLGAMGAFLKVHPIHTTRRSSTKKIMPQFHETFPSYPSMGHKGKEGQALGWIARLGSEELGGNLSVSSSSVPQDEAAAPSGAPGLPNLDVDQSMPTVEYHPNHEVFPLLLEPYSPDTLDIYSDRAELEHWVSVLINQIDPVVEKAVAADKEPLNPEQNAKVDLRGKALRSALHRIFQKVLSNDPAHAVAFSLSELFQMREDALHQHGFEDIYKLDKARENQKSLEVLPIVLAELDGLPGMERLTALIEGALAANIFDWGAQACMKYYAAGSIVNVYREARVKFARRPWRLDNFASLAEKWFSRMDEEDIHTTAVPPSPFRRVIMFVDNAGADVILGMLPLARELLRMGAEVVMVANEDPAINDVTAGELRAILREASEKDPIIKEARDSALAAKRANGGRIPPFPGEPRRAISCANLASLAEREGESVLQSLTDPRPVGESPPPPARTFASMQRKPRLYVCKNGHSSPCLDLRRIPTVLADATVGCDLVIIEGMGRAIHTNFNARFRCASLKLAMIKNEHLARRMFKDPPGKMYDCVCKYEDGGSSLDTV